ncbi:MAG: DUF4350 domain-containing protein [Candidatus Bathyarchaeota archaeon]|nr:DUF4350 domain-containing protein [Candidatus Bathyarchaeota archaeon]
MKTGKLLLTIMLIIVLSMAILIWFFPANGNFRAENPFWNGISEFNSQMNAEPIESFSDLPSDPDGTTLFIIPYEPFSEAELTQLRSYVSNGGILTVLDDYGYGNQILSAIGLNLRFIDKPLLDPLFDYKNKWLPEITEFTNTPIAKNVSSIVFNHASSLNTTTDVTVVAYSSKFSFLDLNADGSWDTDESTGPLPVAAYAKLDQGYLVAISDPSILINGMIGISDNQQFIQNVLSLKDVNQVFVDQTHLPKVPLDGAKEILASVYGIAASPLGALSLIAVILVLSLKPIWRIDGENGSRQ